MCTTIEVVRETVHDRLYQYELEQMERIQDYLPYQNMIMSVAFSGLKKRLREAIHEQFGVTMYEILALDDDYYHFMNALNDFNSLPYAKALKKNSVVIQYKLLDLSDKIEKYRQHCLSCALPESRRSKQLIIFYYF